MFLLLSYPTFSKIAAATFFSPAKPPVASFCINPPEDSSLNLSLVNLPVLYTTLIGSGYFSLSLFGLLDINGSPLSILSLKNLSNKTLSGVVFFLFLTSISPTFEPKISTGAICDFGLSPPIAS